ncbi:MAG: hypothetical protein AVDCRST_MAG55-135, partial [uncultured Rubrobacteraceae bacterium]
LRPPLREALPGRARAAGLRRPRPRGVVRRHQRRQPRLELPRRRGAWEAHERRGPGRGRPAAPRPQRLHHRGHALLRPGRELRPGPGGLLVREPLPHPRGAALPHVAQRGTRARGAGHRDLDGQPGRRLRRGLRRARGRGHRQPRRRPSGPHGRLHHPLPGPPPLRPRHPPPRPAGPRGRARRTHL